MIESFAEIARRAEVAITELVGAVMSNDIQDIDKGLDELHAASRAIEALGEALGKRRLEIEAEEETIQ